MNEPDAIEFSESFGMIGAGWWRQVAWADRQGIPKMLGLTTREWVGKYVGGYVKLTLEDRREAVLELAAEGLKQREIAAVIGVDQATVSRDIDADASDETPIHEQDQPNLDAFASDAAPESPWSPSPALMSSDSPEWYTPPHIIEAVIRTLGAIDLDPCADPGRTVPATTHLTPAENGLAHPWHGRIYMNPPYGRSIIAWVERLVSEYKIGHVEQAIALVPARTETDWWATFNTQYVCFVHGRLAFSGQETSAPFPSAAIYLGPKGDAFVAAFAPLGEVYKRVV